MDVARETPAPRVARLTKAQLWAEIETGTAVELRALYEELLAHGYATDGRALTRITARLHTSGN